MSVSIRLETSKAVSVFFFFGTIRVEPLFNLNLDWLYGVGFSELRTVEQRRSYSQDMRIN